MAAEAALPFHNMREIKHRRKVSVFSYKIPQFIIFLIEHFAYRESFIWRKSFISHFAEEFPDALGILEHLAYIAQSVLSFGCIVPEWQRLFYIDYCIDPESGNAPFHPPLYDVIHFFAHFCIFPVKIRLFFMEQMEIALVRMPRKRFPGRPSKYRPPVARYSSRRIPVFYVKVLPVPAVRVLTCLSEPLMLIRAVINDQIHQYIHIASARLSDQTIHVIHGTESGIHIIIIGNIIALISPR